MTSNPLQLSTTRHHIVVGTTIGVLKRIGEGTGAQTLAAQKLFRNQRNLFRAVTVRERFRAESPKLLLR